MIEKGKPNQMSNLKKLNYSHVMINLQTMMNKIDELQQKMTKITQIKYLRLFKFSFLSMIDWYNLVPSFNLLHCFHLINQNYIINMMNIEICKRKTGSVRTKMNEGNHKGNKTLIWEINVDTLLLLTYWKNEWRYTDLKPKKLKHL